MATREPFSHTRRDVLKLTGAAIVGGVSAARSAARESQPAKPMTIIDFEETLARMRFEHYRHPKIDILEKGFRPVGGMVADFAVIEHEKRYHFFYIERRLQEGTPFYPGHEIFFGHASTANYFDWEVHDPVMLVRPGTWEEAHVWAPFVLKHDDEYIMAYTGLNRHLSQNIGLASSRDMFEWKRWDSNPISPATGRPWSFWRADGICSCRDPHLVRHDGRIWMAYTANTKEGATCIALCSTRDLRTWDDHGPILVGLASGYEPRLAGGHRQGSIESAHLLRRGEAWYLFAHAKTQGDDERNWVWTSDRIDRFDFAKRRPFWKNAGGIEVVKDRGDRSLLATFSGGYIRFGEVNWADEKPCARFLTTRDELVAWQS